MRLPPRTSAALAVQQLATRHTANALLAATAARAAAEIAHTGQVSPERVEEVAERFRILLQTALGSLNERDGR